jgi:hypothetical protein
MGEWGGWEGLPWRLAGVTCQIWKSGVLATGPLLFGLSFSTCSKKKKVKLFRRITVQSQPEQIVHETQSQKKKNYKKMIGGLAEDVGFKFKPQYRKKKVKLDVVLHFCNPSTQEAEAVELQV